jgi:hypothetical protein
MQTINSTMMKPVKTIFAISMLLTLFCTCRNAQIQNHTVVIKPYSDQVINTMQGGFGASMHAIEDSLPVSTDGGKYRSWGGSVWGGNPPAEDSIRWKAIYQHADWLGFDWCRVEIDHGMYEPEKGTFTFDNREMRILYRYLDYCQSRNVDVYFTEMWPDLKWLVHKNFLGDGVIIQNEARCLSTNPEGLPGSGDVFICPDQGWMTISPDG